VTTPDPHDLSDRDQPRRLASVAVEVPADPDPSDTSVAENRSITDDGSATSELAALEDALAQAIRTADRERAKRRATVERERAKRAALESRAEKAGRRLDDAKADLRKTRKTAEKSTVKLQREHDARHRAEQERGEWKQRARTLADELAAAATSNADLQRDLEMLRDAIVAEQTRLETATSEVSELQTQLEQSRYDQRAATDEAARLREQLLRLHTELGRVLPARYLRRLGLG
jgi:chromosome segregation ATPase